MIANKIIHLKAIPLVRRLEYLEVFLNGVKNRSEREELILALGEKKKAFEIEKDLALGRGNPNRKNITQANYLLKYCIRLSRDLGFINKVGQKLRLTEKGTKYLEMDEPHRKSTFADAFSEVYPHLTTIILALNRLEGAEVILPLDNKTEFEAESANYGFSIGQINFGTIRDIGTSLGLLNWYIIGIGQERRLHIYMSCILNMKEPSKYIVKLRNVDKWLYAVQFEIDRAQFRETLWNEYLNLVDGVPGSPIFYSAVREQVCAALKLRDDQFDSEIMHMVDFDEVLQVIWSEGVLQYQKDSASMLKSLPPKNEWGRYVVYLKIVRR